MKLFAGLVAAALLVAPGAEAGVFGLFGHKEKSYDSGSRKLPKPIDSPIVRPKLREDHKIGKRGGVHPAQFWRAGWGTEWDVIFNGRQQQHAFQPWVSGN